jgi:hypothetical protein
MAAVKSRRHFFIDQIRGGIPVSNALYGIGKNNLLSAGFNLTSVAMKTTLTDHGVITPNLATHDNYDDIQSGNVGTPQAIGSPTVGVVAAGVFDGADVTYTALSGASVESITVYKDTGTASTSMLLVFLDTGTNLTGGFSPNGGNVTISWNPSGIFAI